MSVLARIVSKLRKCEYGGEGVRLRRRGGRNLRPIHRIAGLEEEIDDLRIKAHESDAWRGRYCALLEECDASRPPACSGGD